MDDVTHTLDATGTAATTQAGDAALERITESKSTASFDLPFELDDLTYRHVPFQTVAHRRVRYRRVGPLKPRPFDLPEDDE